MLQRESLSAVDAGGSDWTGWLMSTGPAGYGLQTMGSCLHCKSVKVSGSNLQETEPLVCRKQHLMH